MVQLQYMPPEVLQRIMEYAVYVAPEEKASQHSKGAVHLNMGAGAINGCLREVFLETVRLHYVFIELRFYRTLPY